MADEAVPVEGPYTIRDYTIANATAVEKGAVMTLSGDRAIIAGAIQTPFAGIAFSEKVASDGQINLGCAISGVWDMKTSEIIPVGAMVKLSGSNLVALATEADLQKGYGVGRALEQADLGEVIEVEVGVM